LLKRLTIKAKGRAEKVNGNDFLVLFFMNFEKKNNTFRFIDNILKDEEKLLTLIKMNLNLLIEIGL
jgi:hypothetical protein